MIYIYMCVCVCVCVCVYEYIHMHVLKKNLSNKLKIKDYNLEEHKGDKNNWKSSEENKGKVEEYR
jgi:hypothetical protein